MGVRQGALEFLGPTCLLQQSYSIDPNVLGIVAWLGTPGPDASVSLCHKTGTPVHQNVVRDPQPAQEGVAAITSAQGLDLQPAWPYLLLGAGTSSGFTPQFPSHELPGTP